MRGHVGAKAAVRIAARVGERHGVANHLPHHVGGPFGDLGRVRYDDDSDVGHGLSSPMTSQMAAIIRQDDRAPGSIWPIERSPRNEARPRKAFIGMVAAAASNARRRSRAVSSVAAHGQLRLHGREHVKHRLLPVSDLPRALIAAIAAPRARATSSADGSAGNSLPSVRKKRPIERSGRATDLHEQGRADRA